MQGNGKEGEGLGNGGSPSIGSIRGLTGRTVFGTAAAPPGHCFSLTCQGEALGPWQKEGAPLEAPFLDGSDCTLLPGFIDVHIHGSGGADMMDATPDSLETMSRFLAQHGVTGFYATTVSASHSATLAAVENVARYVDQAQSENNDGAQVAGARIMGVHLEGPYLNPQFPGAQNPDYLRPPSVEEFEELLAAGPVRMITLAPEVPGAEALIEAALAAGVRVVLGHTAATFEEASAAIGAGVSQATHTFNAMTGLQHRAPGTVGATLSDDRIYAQLIADGIHVHPAAMRILGRCKGPSRTLLISDANRAAGMPPGRYEMGRLPVIVKDGACRLEDGTLAGSVLALDAALRNFMSATGWPLVQAWPSTSLSQAQAMGIEGEVGRIRSGARADLTLLDADAEVVATVVGGRLVFLRDSWRLKDGAA